MIDPAPRAFIVAIAPLLDRLQVLQNEQRPIAPLNAYVTARQGRLTSVPGDIDIRLEALPDSTLPVALRGLGYIVEPIGRTSAPLLPQALHTNRASRSESRT
ncbi:hypothetical protein SAMN05443247_06997 [Bradyrhizobium erythrophlei]|jgi:hypothetical protein|nr:hypothetical protein SAMN05443247_06997 [Bradyrhizobium erythrophlei]